MRLAPTLILIASTSLAAAGPPPRTYGEVAALVARAETRDGVTVEEAWARISASPDTPLAQAALGRLYFLKSRGAAFILLRYLDIYKGHTALNRYIAQHQQDPLPRVWRAAAAVETNYLLWDKAKAAADLDFALAAYRGDPSLPDRTPRCKLLLGVIAKDRGDLSTALRFWREAFAADPLGPAGTEAAKMLTLFTG